jgi:hypothetical protein
MGTPVDAISLSGMADAVGLVAAAAPDLTAADILAEVAPDTSSRPDAQGPTTRSCILIRIDTPDEISARDLASRLRLSPRPAGDGPGWTGIYPLSESAKRPLCLDVVLSDETPTPLITMGEAFGFLDRLDFALQTDVDVVRIHLSARGVATIYTAGSRGAQTLRLELAGVQLPLQPAVVAPTDRTSPTLRLQGPVS